MLSIRPSLTITAYFAVGKRHIDIVIKLISYNNNARVLMSSTYVTHRLWIRGAKQIVQVTNSNDVTFVAGGGHSIKVSEFKGAVHVLGRHQRLQFFVTSS